MLKLFRYAFRFTYYFGFGSALLINSLSKDMEVDYKPNIEMNKRQISIKDKIMIKILSPVVEEVGTYAFVLINDKGLYYIFDPTNLTIFSIDDMDCKNINGQGGSIINPIFSYMMNIDTDRTSVLDDFILSDFKFKEFVSKEDYVDRFETHLDTFRREEKLINMFSYELKPRIEIINSSILEYKRKHKK